MSRWMRDSLKLSVKAYRLLFSAWLGVSCRFYPTCSAYALEALDRHGAATGSYLTLRRIARCHPWCDAGVDLVPEEVPRIWPWRFYAPQRSASLFPAERDGVRPTCSEKTTS